MTSTKYFTALTTVTEDLGSILSEMYGSETPDGARHAIEMKYVVGGGGENRLADGLTKSVRSVRSVHEYLGHTNGHDDDEDATMRGIWADTNGQQSDDALSYYARLKISSVLWFYPAVTRKQAETMLDGKVPGTFLVRNSRQVGNFAVSVCLPPGMEVDIQHYLITRDDAGLCFDQAGRYFADLEALVAHYVVHMSDGMPCLLKLPTLIATPTTKLELTLAVEREAERRAMMALNVMYSQLSEDKSESREASLDRITEVKPKELPNRVTTRQRRSKTCSSITEKHLKELIKGRTSDYFNVDEDNYATTDGYDVGKIRPLVKRSRRAVTISSTGGSRRGSRDTELSLCSMESEGREEEDGHGTQKSRFRAVIARLKRPFVRGRLRLLHMRRSKSTSHDVLRTSTPIKIKPKSHSLTMVQQRLQTSMDVPMCVALPSVMRPRMPSPGRDKKNRRSSRRSSGGTCGDGIYSSLGSSNSDSLIDSDIDEKDDEPPPVPPRPSQVNQQERREGVGEGEDIVGNDPNRPVSATYASIDDVGVKPETSRPPPLLPVVESTSGERPKSPPPRPPKEEKLTPPPLPERRRIATLATLPGRRTEPRMPPPPPLPTASGNPLVSGDVNTPPEVPPRPRAVTLPALFPSHMDAVTESDYLVPIEEILRNSRNNEDAQSRDTETETSLTSDSRSVPPPQTVTRSKDEEDGDSQVVVALPMSVAATPMGTTNRAETECNETSLCSLSLPLMNGITTTGVETDDSACDISPGVSFTTDDLPPLPSPSVELAYRRSNSESLLDSLTDDTSTTVRHLLAGRSLDSLEEMQPVVETESRVMVEFTRVEQDSKIGSLKRHATDSDIHNPEKHSDMPDETRIRSNTVSRMRASVRQTRERLASHSKGVRHSFLEQERIATLVGLGQSESGEISEVTAAAERARLTILHSGPKLLALRKRRTPSRKIGGHISKMAATKNTKLGFNIEKFVSKIKSHTHDDPGHLVTEIRNFLNQLKMYLLNDSESELAGVLTKEPCTDDVNLDAVVEGVLVQAVIRPLHKRIRRCFSGYYEQNGSLQLLSDNLHLASQKTPVQLGVKDDLIPPQGPSLDHIRGRLNKMQASHSPLCKLEHLLATVDIIYQSVKNSKTEVAGEDLVLGADDFLPIFIYVLAQVQFHHAEIEAEYMWGLLDPTLLSGEGGYYLTTLSSAVMVLKQIHEPTECDGAPNRKRRRPTRLPRIGDLQGYMRVRMPDEYNTNINMAVFKTLPIGPKMTVLDACHLIGQKMAINNLENYTLYKVIDNKETILEDDFHPQHLKMEWVLLDLEAEHEGKMQVERYFAFKRKPFTDL